MILILLIVVIAAIILATSIWKIHPLPTLLAGAFLFGTANQYGILKTIDLIAAGFGNTIKGIGLVVIAGTIIGVFMENRGALRVIAEKMIAFTGKKRASMAMGIIGYIVSICIFCDSAFVILIGLWRKIGTLAKLPLAVGATALSMGLFASHCFIPPTPGPLAALNLLQADFVAVLSFGAIAAAAATAAGYFYAAYFGKNEILSELPQSDLNPEEIRFQHHPLIAFLPIIVPLLLIGTGSILKVIPEINPGCVDFFSIAGNPVAALSIGAVIAIFFLGKCRRQELTVDGLMGKAVLDAANILVITAAGGAFGEVLKQVDFTPFLPKNCTSWGAFAILIPLGFAALLKIAQGSSTLAILTAAGVSLPLLETLGLDAPMMRALTCCAVCCGGMIVSHTNDSFFWVVTRFSGMSVRQGLKLQTLGTLVSGIAAAVTLVLLALAVS